jgi:hypothetical protein
MTELEKLLPYYKVLQPLFKEKMGKEPINGDVFYNSHIKQVVSLDKVSDSWYHSFQPNPMGSRCLKEVGVIIPQTIDILNPKRGLWGMIKGFDVMHTAGCDGWYIETVYQSHGKGFHGDTPTEAILKALCEQEGVKI